MRAEIELERQRGEREGGGRWKKREEDGGIKRSSWKERGMHEARRIPFAGTIVTPGLSPSAIMPKIRTSRTKRPPEGFEDIESVSLRCTRLVFLGDPR